MYDKPVAIAQELYWVGINAQESGLHCNPYLIVAGDEAALIDPGSPLDFPYVRDKVTSIIPLENLKYIILQHQDPDLAASTPLFEQAGASVTIVTHWRTAQLVKYYGVTSPFHLVSQQNNFLRFSNGRLLEFIPTPYLHCPGAIATYDHETQTLLSSDLFGAYSHQWSLYADELSGAGGRDVYMDAMVTFHEHYMPSNDILRPVMDSLLQFDIRQIAPQHGSVIRHNVKEYMAELRRLECGSLLYPVKTELTRVTGLENVCNEIIRRLFAIFPLNEIQQVFANTPITIDEQQAVITDYTVTSEELWQTIFRTIAVSKGWPWLTAIEPLTIKLAHEHGIGMPEVFSSSLLSMQKEMQAVAEENRQLKAINERLEQSLAHANDTLLKCPITGLYNQSVLMNYLQEEVNTALNSDFNSALLLISVDNMANLNTKYGGQIGNEIIRSVGYSLNELRQPTHNLFKTGGASFAYYIANTNRDQANETAETIRTVIAKSDLAIEPVTVSIGIAMADEAGHIDTSKADHLFVIAHNRMQIARLRGQNQVCGDTAPSETSASRGKILIAEHEQSNTDILRSALEQEQYEVLVAPDGEKALKLIYTQSPDIVITELMLPKLNAFLLREKMQQTSTTQNIPFILLAFYKDADSVQRAMSLGIDYYLQKPYFLEEVIGIVKNQLTHRAGKDHS